MPLETFEDNSALVATTPPPVSIDAQPVDNTVPVSIDAAPVTNEAPSVEVANARANKAVFGFNQLLPQKTKDDIFQSLVTGKEQDLRKEAATANDLRDDINRNNIISEIAKQKKGPLTQEELGVLDFHIQAARNKKPSDPSSIIETQFADQWMKYLDITANRTSNTDTWDWSDSTMAKASMEMPEHVTQAKEAGRTIVAKNQYIQTKIENVEDMIKNQSSLGRSLDYLKTWVPFYEDFKLRLNSGDTSMIAGLLGTQKEEMAKDIRRRSFDDFTKTLDGVVDNLIKDNPQEALVFLQSMRGMSTENVYLSNIFNLVDLTTLPIGKATIAAVRGLKIFNASQTAVKDTVKAVGTEVPNKAALAAGAGDFGEAAAQKGTANILNEVHGQPNLTQRAIEALHSPYNIDRTAIKNDPGTRAGQEILNELDQRYARDAAVIVDEVGKMSRVERIPEAIVSEATQRKLQADILEDFRPAMRNNHVDTIGPFHETYSNTWYYTYRFGKKGAELYQNEMAARSAAKTNGYDKFSVAQKGDGWVISVDKHIPTNHDLIRDGLVELNKIEEPSSIMKDMVSKLNDYRTPDEIFNLEHRANRKTAMFASSILYRVAKSMAADIQEVAKTGFFSRVPVEGFAPETRTSFTTAKGSTYAVQKDGTTIRNKAARNEPGHEGDFGLKPKSGKTVYLTEQDANRLAPPQSRNRFIDHEDGTLSLATPAPKSGWGISPLQKNVPYVMEPKEGLIPLELFSPKKTLDTPSFGDHHFGNSITKVEHLELTSTDVTSISKKQRWQDWERIVKLSRDIYDENGQLGSFYKGIGELESAYMQHIKRLPDAAEIHAYFAFSRLVEFDRSLRNLLLYRNKANVGAETHTVFAIGSDGAKVASKPFDGITHRTLPRGNYTVAFMGDEVGKENLVIGSKATQSKLWETMEAKIAEGRAKVIEIFDTEARPLRGYGSIGDEKVRYVITSNMETKPLTFDQVPRRGAGHFDMEYPHYITQAKIAMEKVGNTVNHWFEGHNVVMPMALKSMGREVVGKFNSVRELIRDGKLAEAKSLVEDGFQGLEWKEVHSWFKPSVGIDGRMQPPRLNINEPFNLTRVDDLHINMDKGIGARYTPAGAAQSTFRDGTREGSLARQNIVQYASERDNHKTMTMVDKGTKSNPLYNYEPAKLIDPIPTMHRALNRIINSAFLDDYKMYGMERWLAKAQPWLKAQQAEIRSNPLYHFYKHDPKQDYVRDIPEAVENQLNAEHSGIMNLMKLQSPTDTFLQSTSQKLADSIYSKYGPTESQGMLRRSMSVSEPWVISNLNKPAQILRAITFHKVMGAFNWVQLLVQNMTYVTIAGLAGRRALPGTVGALFHQFARMNGTKEFVDHLDQVASKLTFGLESAWKAGEFREAREELSKTGFDHIGREHTLYEQSMSPKLISNGAYKILDTGTLFFKAAERNVRYGSWYTAFREFRDANPLKKITNADRNKILERADLLSGNMTVASKSMVQKGIMEFPTQFLSYQLRLVEQMTGKRLTPRDKKRMMAVYAVMYGLPSAAGLAGLPFGDTFRGIAQDHGYTVGDNFFTTTLMEGVPSMLGALATGDYYNIGQRLGSPGFDLIREGLAGDKSFWEIAGGASGSALMGAFENAGPFWQMGMSMMRRDETVFPIVANDVHDVLRSVATYNQGFRMLAALNSSNWESRKGLVIDTDISPLKAIFMTASGLQTQQMADLHNESLTVKSREAFQKHVEDMFTHNIQLAIKAADNKDTAQATQYFTRATIYIGPIGDYPVEKLSGLFQRAFGPEKSLMERIDFSLYLKNVPASKSEAMLKTLARKQELKQRK